MGVSHTGPVFQGPAFEPTSADDPVTVSGHRIGAVLGEGALGRVYLASAPGGQPVALTVVRQPADGQADFEARFHRDAQAAGRVPGGPHTVPVLGSGKEGDRYWIATAYVPAVSLRSAVAGGGPLPTGVVLRLVAGLAEGLRTVHHEGVVHGDLRPAHVLLTAEGPRLKGYGLASLVADPAAGGGPVFLAPEQAAGKRPVAATDVFALGQLAAYASIGTAPFGEGPLDGILPRVLQEEPDLNELPGELREIVTRCLIKDPALRPSLAQITAMCEQASPAARRRADPWLPPALLAAIPPLLVPFTPPGPRAAAGPGGPGATPAAPPAGPVPGSPQGQIPANMPGVPPTSIPATLPGVQPFASIPSPPAPFTPPGPHGPQAVAGASGPAPATSPAVPPPSPAAGLPQHPTPANAPGAVPTSVPAVPPGVAPSVPVQFTPPGSQAAAGPAAPPPSPAPGLPQHPRPANALGTPPTSTPVAPPGVAPSVPVPFAPQAPQAAAGPAVPPPSPVPGVLQNPMPANAPGAAPTSMPAAPLGVAPAASIPAAPPGIPQSPPPAAPPGVPPAPIPAPPPPGSGSVPPPLAAPPAVHPGAVGRWGPQAWPGYVQAALPVRRPRRRTAGVVGVVVALAVAVTAGVALAGGVGEGHGKGGSVAATTDAKTTPTVPNGGGGATGSAEAPSPPPTTPEAYQGFRLPAGYALSWQAGSPVVRPGTYSGDFGYTPEADAFATDTNQGTLALIAPRGSGTLAECRAGGLQTASIPRRLVT
ncbi:MAG: serine/threonine kinase PknH, partial [Streptomyces sp.]|nr:serine/threonine kinase PknH [Streptomyces sp.]